MFVIQVPGPGQAIQDAAQNFFQIMLQKERLEQEERRNEILEQRAKLEQEEFENKLEQQRQLLQNFAQQQPTVQQAVQGATPDQAAQMAGEVAQGEFARSAAASPMAPPPQAVVPAAQQQFQQGGPLQQVQAARALGFSPTETTTALGLQQTAEETDTAQEDAQIIGQALRGVASGATGEELGFDAARLQLAMQRAEVPSQLQNRAMTNLFPTESEELQQTVEDTRQRFLAGAMGKVVNLFEQGASVTDLTQIDDPTVQAGVAALSGPLGTQVRQLRNKFTQRGLDRSEALDEYYMEQAEAVIEDRGLQGAVNPRRVANFLRTGEGGDATIEVAGETTTLEQELGQFQRGTRIAAQSAMAADVANLPSIGAVDQQISAIMQASGGEPSDEQIKQLTELFDAKAQIAEQQLGIDRSDPSFPFPTAVTEKNVRTLLSDQESFSLTVTPEGRALNSFIVSNGGSVDQALQAARERRAQATERGSVERESINQVIEQLQRLKDAGVDEISASPQ